MSGNDSIVLDSILKQKRQESANTFPESEYFEIFTFEQALKNFDLSYDELLDGNVDGCDDGGIDGFFVFINNEILNEDIDISNINKSPTLDIYLIQSKEAHSFQELVLDKLIATVQDIFDLDKPIAIIERFYNSLLIAKVELFRRIYVDLAIRHPEVSVNYIYASKGNSLEIHPKLYNKSENLKSITQSYFLRSEVKVEFLGSRQLLEANRQEKTYCLQLRFLENCISTGEDNYIVLSKLKDYYEFVVDKNENLRNYLFESNVRDYQGNVEVNRDIKDTLAKNGTTIDFWWLNNGITILASKASIAGKIINLDDVQIVNGLQTTNTIYEYLKARISIDGLNSDNKSSLVKVEDNRAILIKIIVTSDLEARDRIIKATNFQTPVPASSLRATERTQRDIEDYFLENGWFYDRRKNYYKNIGKPSDKIVGIPYLAQAFTAIIYHEPHKAKARPTTIIKEDNSYKKVFNSLINIKVYLFCSRVMKAIEICIRNLDFSQLRDECKSELIKPAIVRSFIFHIAMLLTMKMLRKSNYALKDVVSLVETKLDEELNDELLLETIIVELIKIIDDYLRIETSFLSINTVAKRSEFTSFLIKQVNVYPSCLIKTVSVVGQK